MKLFLLIFISAATVLLIYGPGQMKKKLAGLEELTALYQEAKTKAPQKLPDMSDKEIEDTLGQIQEAREEMGIPMDNTERLAVQAPGVEKLKEVFMASRLSKKTGAPGIKEKYSEKFPGIRDTLKNSMSYIILAGAAIVVFSFLSKTFNAYSAASFLAKLAWFAGQSSLLLISVGALPVWFMIKHNLWRDLGAPLIYIPLSLLGSAALGLYLLDFNYPVWKRLYAAVFFPAVSGIILAVFSRV